MLKGMHNFSIETQTQYHAPLAIDTHKAPDGGIVKADQLKAFINAAEWNLAATGSRDPTLHFIAYLPTPDLRPLRSIHDNGELGPARQPRSIVQVFSQMKSLSLSPNSDPYTFSTLPPKHRPKMHYLKHLRSSETNWNCCWVCPVRLPSSTWARTTGSRGNGGC
jgi:hypothetical protein